jgi:hypothetical protein
MILKSGFRLRNTTLTPVEIWENREQFPSCRLPNQNWPVRVELKPATFSLQDLAHYFALLTATPLGKVSPVMKLALIGAPVLASYSPTVPPKKFATKRVLPDTASPKGSPSPVIKLGLIAAPVLASYLPTVLPEKFDTKRVLPDTASPKGSLSPVIKLGLIAAPVLASYLPTTSIVPT